MEGNYWLNINIEGNIANLHCLFRYFKSLRSFLLTLISLYKNKKKTISTYFDSEA